MSGWAAPVAPGPITGRVVVPGSKSASARALLLAALSDREAHLSGVLESRDTALMREGLTQLGARFTDVDELVHVVPLGSVQGGSTIAAGLAGTVMRFLPPIAALSGEPTTFTGDPALANRPVAPLLTALADLGATVSQPLRVPFSVSGQSDFAGGEVVIDASGSSQFVSALLLVGARYREGITVVHRGAALPSRPHVEMTVTMLRQRGVRIDQPDDNTWHVHAGPITGKDDTVEPDLTNAATFLAAALITSGELTTHWPAGSVQAADALAATLACFGAELSYSETATGRDLTVRGSGVIGAEVDLHDVSELTPVAAALAAVADRPSVIRGVAHIRGHETDRIAALAAELSAIGVTATPTPDGLRIVPGPRRAGTFHTYADHRLAHAGALVGLVTPGVELDDVTCTTKTLPDFTGLWDKLLRGAR